uniref:uncharacterized protein LOC120336820 n=1 Tax=Styela clava TaxID=7725 RepID=UPI00193A5B7C|nr:uncharacterized protein LOC120336820 [Styela clava]
MTTTIITTNVSEGFNGTMLTPGSTKIHDDSFNMRPGITTLISFAVAIVLVIVYLYYENVISCVKTVCFRRHPSKTGDSSAENIEMGTNGDQSSSTAFTGRKLTEEPGILCECGQIHLLKDCLKESELSPYKDIFDRIRNLTPDKQQTTESEGTTPLTTSLSRESVSKTHNVPRQTFSRIQQSPTTPVIVICDEKGNTKKSSPKSLTPPLQSRPSRAVGISTVVHAQTGARPKEYKIENGVS